MNKERFKDAPWLMDFMPIVSVLGAGGIGSWTSLLVVRAGFKLYLTDFDTIESHNLGGQLFREEDLGQHKVKAVASIVKSFTGDNIHVSLDPITSTQGIVSPITIAAFDNMKARKDAFELWLKNSTDKTGAIFIDGRLTAEQIQIFCVTPDKATEYKENYLFDDSEVEEISCTFKQTSHAAAMIASHIVGFLTNHYSNVVEPKNARKVPFFWEYYIPIDYNSVDYGDK